MKKRDFIWSLGWFGIVMLFSGVFLGGCSEGPPFDSAQGPALDAAGDIRGMALSKKEGNHWVWTGVDKDATDLELKERFTFLHSMGVTGILIGGDDERMFRLSKTCGLNPHVWMWTLNRGEAFIKDNHPEWYAVNRLGESCFDKPQYVDYYRWLCPSRPEVLDYLREEVLKLLEKPYIEGIHLDYVRYCDVILPRALWEKYDIVQNEELPPYDYCYCDVCRSKFENETGRDPLLIADPSTDEDWLQFRYNSVSKIVNALSDLVHEHHKPISAAVFPTPEVARTLVRQDWDKWNLDMVFPMIYHGFYNESVEWVGQCVKEDVAATQKQLPIHAGLYLPDFKHPEELARAYELAIENGAEGVSLFGAVKPEYWQALNAAVAKK